MTPSAPVYAAIVGMGTVGTGVARILQSRERIAKRAGREIVLRRAVVRDLQKTRGIELPSGTVTTDLQAVLRDPEISVAMHLVGGLHPAKEILLQLLEAGKDVITANKAVLCEYGPELFQTAGRLGRTIAFEAAVAGGIPIIATVGQCLAANQITSIAAILNGTSNFILSQMAREHWSYSNALRRAQELGYAEADPTLDVDGTDAAQKLVILAQLAFGMRVPLAAFPRSGIDTLQLADMNYAAELGYGIKLLAVAKLIDNEVEMHVQPTLLRQQNPLANIHGALNAVSIVGDAVGETWYSGPGAGQLPTASAVVADLIDTVVGRTRLTFPRLDLWESHSPYRLRSSEKTVSRFYLRFNVDDRPHVLADIAAVLGQNQISIASVIQHEAADPLALPGADKPVVPLVIMTHKTSVGAMQVAMQAMNSIASLHPPTVVLPVAD